MSLVDVGKVRVTATGLVRRKEAAAAIGLRPKTLCEWAAKGIGPSPVKIGGRVFYRWSELQAFANNGQ